MTRIIAALLLCSAVAPSAPVYASEMIIDSRGWNFYPLEFSELVVIGEVSRVHLEKVSQADLWMDPPEVAARTRDIYTSATRIELSVREVLRGAAGPNLDALIVMFNDDYRCDYEVGATVLLCLNWHPRLQAYYLQSSYGKYLYRDSNWVCDVPSNGRRMLTDHEVRQMIAATSIGQVTKDAELIVVGDVVSVQRKNVTIDDGARVNLTTLVLRVREIRKGSYKDSEIAMNMISGGRYWPAWRKLVPRRFEVGETWYAYLKKDIHGWFPFAGSNGLLLLHDGQLIYEVRGSRVPYWRDTATVDRLASRQEKE